MSLIIEIRAGEGGADSKDLVNIQFGIYSKYARRNNINIEAISIRDGIIVFRASGKNVEKLFINESGIMRWQRVPPTEKKGRVHTSTITIAVLPEPEKFETPDIKKEDLEIKTTRGSGAGGQHRNVTDSAVQIKHIPTGIIVRCEGERSQHQNKEDALRVLSARLLEQSKRKAHKDREGKRREQVGGGGRAEEKVRTIRVQDDKVEDHINNVSITYKSYTKGQLEDLNK